MFEVFQRYEPFTDLAALNEFSAKPLRKSVRINTIKCSVEEFQKNASQKGWTLTQVPWCKEAFFVERENREQALGKDIGHLLGHFYMQEAASMLPPELLQPQPDDIVLDMSAAPGSKTTQMGAMMSRRLPAVAEGDQSTKESAHLRQGYGGQPSAKAGVIVANDVQEKRLWTLKSSTHRSGVHNVIVTKKVGQWFAKHMTERFDRVLCDAPCSAQGTARKDSDALNYCSLENIEKMARLQYQLLESAIHAAKVGGRIVYSTCTLTPEENEGTVMQIVEKFKGMVEVVDPRELKIENGEWRMDQAIEDSIKVQASFKDNSQFSIHNYPFLRLWPQTYDTEGFFCAVLRKKASTRDIEPMEWVHPQERYVGRGTRSDYEHQLVERFGTSFLNPDDALFERGGESLILTSKAVADFGMPVEDYALGMPFGKKLKDGRVLLDHECAILRGHQATKNILEVNDEQLALLLDAKDCDCPADLRGHTLLQYRGHCIGIGLAKEGHLKNNLPRWMVRFG